MNDDVLAATYLTSWNTVRKKVKETAVYGELEVITACGSVGEKQIGVKSRV